jgi:PAS domain S-box-containing protein
MTSPSNDDRTIGTGDDPRSRPSRADPGARRAPAAYHRRGPQAGERGPPAPAARRRAARYRRFLDALGVAVYTTDSDGRITFFNAAAAEFWGRSPAVGEEWCGSSAAVPDESPMRHDECPMAITLKEARPVRGGQAIAVRPDGSNVSFMAYPTPLFADDGELIGAVNVLVDITERHQAEQAMRAAADALEASNAVKDEFLGLVSHELRTPVTTIFGNARLLQTHGAELTDELRASMIADIATDADRLHSIIENLLHLTRLGAGPGRISSRRSSTGWSSTQSPHSGRGTRIARS